MDTVRREERKRTTKGDVDENILQGSSSCGHHIGGMCNCCCRPVTLETTHCCPMCQAAREELSLSLSMCCMCDAQSATIKHENVNTFIGLCLVAPNVSIVMLHAHEGCLYDLLLEDD